MGNASYQCKNLEQTKKLACEIATSLQSGDVLALFGDLGSGKTTFTRYLVEALGTTDRVQSPTFVLHRIYNMKNSNTIRKINHLDLYRIVDLQDATDLDLEHYLAMNDSATIIEWPEIVFDILPKNTKLIKFKVIDDTAREIQIQNKH